MRWGIFTYLIIMNFFASFFLMILSHELYHYLVFQPYATSICIDFGNDEIAHVGYVYPYEGRKVVESIAENNERWATFIGFSVFLIVFIVNTIKIARLCYDNPQRTN